MSIYNHIFDSPKNITQCVHCKKEYKQTTEEQVPGFRSREYDICPYCNESNGSSMKEEYYNQKID